MLLLCLSSDLYSLLGEVWVEMFTGPVELQLIIHLLALSDLVLKEVVCVVQHLLHSSKQQYVSVLVQVQLLTVVLHRQHTGQGDAQRLTQLPGLKESGLIFQYHHKDKCSPQ